VRAALPLAPTTALARRPDAPDRYARTLPSCKEKLDMYDYYALWHVINIRMHAKLHMHSCEE
jgi:hypothetical protein